MANCLGATEVVMLLLARDDIDVNAKGDFTLVSLAMAAEMGNTEIVRLLLDNPECDVNLDFPLYHAAINNNTEVRYKGSYLKRLQPKLPSSKHVGHC